ncbi:MAG: preprotein translocase subunit Tim44 [Alphaproteobacteria bacterium HGW-Alphaproteobacteria-2]|nr:MAG: preprotein translocase subunit Tim44 [Alphaproteobacteria bacterium HGW-Alphaproteobacteria-2]
MSSAVLQLIVLAAIAIFLILRLRSVLGTREGFEKPPLDAPAPRRTPERDFTVVEDTPDPDIADHLPADSRAADAVAQMKAVEPDFSLGGFLQGARGAYEMILMAYERGDLSDIEPFLAPEVRDSFGAAIAARQGEGLTVDAEFVGLRDVGVVDASFDPRSGEAEIKIKFTGELTSVVRNATGAIVEGSATEIRRQRDVWTFARRMGSDDPNWSLVATG